MTSRLPVLLVVLSITAAAAQLNVFDLRASDLPSNILGTTDGYVKVFSRSTLLGETSVRNNNEDPWWEEEFTDYKAQEEEELRLEVWDSDYLFDDLVGVCQRKMKPGTHKHDCFLDGGGTLHYSYTLGNSSRAAAGTCL
ncbi:perforin-1-like [Cololabis saira]|uniref:perforin-1-like n=1 Tax=Cololabis saira TaxID=129043 RepID=UPI002AD1F2D8|nr:perforin-1-like [Cololabis saira]